MRYVFFLLLISFGLQVEAITRVKVLDIAKSYADHTWTCEEKNTIPTCSSTWRSDYTPGIYQGLPYNWGGYMTIVQFERDLTAGKGAGSHARHGILSCTTGVDCSGYVSQCWQMSRQTTSTMDEASHIIKLSEVLPGDAFNYPGHHVVLWVGESVAGLPIFYEAAGDPVSKVWLNNTASWSELNGFKPIRYNEITESETRVLEGSRNNPVKIASIPFTHIGNTQNSGEYFIDEYPWLEGVESGPEIYYRLRVEQPLRNVNMQLQQGVEVELNLHICKTLVPLDCMSQTGKQINLTQLPKGDYWLIVDTWQGLSAKPYAGAYALILSSDQ